MNASLFNALQAAGIPTRKLPSQPQYGRFYRDGAAWFKMLTDSVAIFGDWARDIKGTWFADNLPTDPKTVAETKRLIALEQQRNQRALAKQWQEAAIRARATWFDYAIAADFNHLYLQKKRLKPYGLRQFGADLIVPVYSLSDSKVMSLQFISPSGSKRFLTGGKTKGGYFAARKYKENEPIIISEGWATSQSLAQQWQVQGWHLVCFNAGNLINVARAMRQRHPYAEIILAVDNDLSGAGQQAAKDAAKAVNARLFMPEFTQEERQRFGKISDWNDRYLIDLRLNATKREVKRYVD